MELVMKAPDRIYTTIKVKDLTTAIDDAPYLGLERTSISRSELFLFAMALGAEAIPTKLDSINSGGLVLEKSIDSRTKALMYALYIEHMTQKDNLDAITNKGEVYNQAQEYANTGFEVIEGYMQQKKDQDLIWDLLIELDEQYKKEFSEE